MNKNITPCMITYSISIPNISLMIVNNVLKQKKKHALQKLGYMNIKKFFLTALTK